MEPVGQTLVRIDFFDVLILQADIKLVVKTLIRKTPNRTLKNELAKVIEYPSV